MHRDKKLGLALGVLIVGIVGAFFFRNEDGLLLTAPRLTNPSTLDEQISEGQLVPYLTGVETDLLDELDETPLDEDEVFAQTGDASVWDAPDFLKESSDIDEDFFEDSFSQTSSTPDPIQERRNINQHSQDNGDLTLEQIGMTNRRQRSVRKNVNPQHNQAWTATSRSPRRRSVQPVSENSSRRQPAGVRYHQVRPGDTLSGIASRYLGSSRRYYEIYGANKDILDDPNDLQVGMKLVIPDSRKTTASNTQRQSQSPRSSVKEQDDWLNEPLQAPQSQSETPSATLFFEDVPSTTTETETKPISSTRTRTSQKFIPVRRHPFAPRYNGVRTKQPTSQRNTTTPMAIKSPVVEEKAQQQSEQASDVEWDDLSIDWDNDPFQFEEE